MSSNSTINIKPETRHHDTMLVIVFCLLITIPIILTPFTFPNSKARLANENRLTATWPTLQNLQQDFTDTTAQINKYLEDHLSFRQHLLNFYAGLYFKIMQTGSGKSAIIGKDGWLFLGRSNSLENARGVIPLDPTDAQDWTKKASIINDMVNSYGGQFLIVIVPDKPQVYSEYLPGHIVYQRAGRRADTLAQELEEASLPHIDLLDTLLKAKQDHASPIYSKTDTHWSFVGALDGYQATIHKLNSYGLNIPIVERLQLQVITVEDFSGDLSRLLNLEEYFQEDLRLLTPHRDKNKFSRDKKLLLLGDSFAGNQIQFFDYSFIKTTCVHHDWGNIDLDIIREQQADIVILQMVERGLEYSLSVDAQTSRPCGEGF